MVLGTDLTGKMAVVTGAGGILCGMFARTLARAGPTQGVHAKLKVNPMIKAVIGDMASISSLKGSLCSFPMAPLLPKNPS